MSILIIKTNWEDGTTITLDTSKIGGVVFSKEYEGAIRGCMKIWFVGALRTSLVPDMVLVGVDPADYDRVVVAMNERRPTVYTLHTHDGDEIGTFPLSAVAAVRLDDGDYPDVDGKERVQVMLNGGHLLYGRITGETYRHLLAALGWQDALQSPSKGAEPTT